MTAYGQNYRNDRKEELNQKERDRYTEMTKIKLTCKIFGAKHYTKHTSLHLRSRRHQDALNKLSADEETNENISDIIYMSNNDISNTINPKKKISCDDIKKIVDDEPNYKIEHNTIKNKYQNY